MYTYEEVAIKTESIKDMFLLKERQCYKILGAMRSYLFSFNHFMHVNNECNSVTPTK